MKNNSGIFEVDTQLLQRLVDHGHAPNLAEALKRSIVLFEFLSSYKQPDGSLRVVDGVGDEKREAVIMVFNRS